MCANWLQSCLTLCDPMDYIACQAPLSMGILQKRILEWVAMPSSRGSSWPRDSTHVSYASCTGKRGLNHEHHLGSPTNVNAATAATSLQLCLTLCDPIDGSPPGSRIPGILQPRTLQWVAISFSDAWKWKVKVKSLGHVQLFVTPWPSAYKAPPSMVFSRQEYWSGLPLPSPTNVNNILQTIITMLHIRYSDLMHHLTA